jgi:hypothetical protein
MVLAGALGVEGIRVAVSLLRTLDWIKCKNLDSPAVKRESEGDWR